MFEFVTAQLQKHLNRCFKNNKYSNASHAILLLRSRMSYYSLTHFRHELTFYKVFAYKSHPTRRKTMNTKSILANRESTSYRQCGVLLDTWADESTCPLLRSQWLFIVYSMANAGLKWCLIYRWGTVIHSNHFTLLFLSRSVEKLYQCKDKLKLLSVR